MTEGDYCFLGSCHLCRQTILLMCYFEIGVQQWKLIYLQQRHKENELDTDTANKQIQYLKLWWNILLSSICILKCIFFDSSLVYSHIFCQIYLLILMYITFAVIVNPMIVCLGCVCVYIKALWSLKKDRTYFFQQATF